MMGEHGYDPESPMMDHPLLARGPAFRRQFELPSRLENVDVAWLTALVLQLPLSPGSVNGSRQSVLPLLATNSAEFWAGGTSTGFWMAGRSQEERVVIWLVVSRAGTVR